MLGLSPLELVVIGLVIVVLFGTKRLPELGTGLGKAINNFKQSFKDPAIDVTPDKTKTTTQDGTQTQSDKK